MISRPLGQGQRAGGRTKPASLNYTKTPHTVPPLRLQNSPTTKTSKAFYLSSRRHHARLRRRHAPHLPRPSCRLRSLAPARAPTAAAAAATACLSGCHSHKLSVDPHQERRLRAGTGRGRPPGAASTPLRPPGGPQAPRRDARGTAGAALRKRGLPVKGNLGPPKANDLKGGRARAQVRVGCGCKQAAGAGEREEKGWARGNFVYAPP